MKLPVPDREFAADRCIAENVSDACRPQNMVAQCDFGPGCVVLMTMAVQMKGQSAGQNVRKLYKQGRMRFAKLNAPIGPVAFIAFQANAPIEHYAKILRALICDAPIRVNVNSV